jgi:hypothetical protein
MMITVLSLCLSPHDTLAPERIFFTGIYRIIPVSRRDLLTQNLYSASVAVFIVYLYVLRPEKCFRNLYDRDPV